MYDNSLLYLWIVILIWIVFWVLYLELIEKLKGIYVKFFVIFFLKGRNCFEFFVVNNVMLMIKRVMYRYMDKIIYMCDLGYVKFRGEEIFICGLDG